jgi:ElaB/YqjD/DUF883 family membrane-anchored ribosome-binding protein
VESLNSLPTVILVLGGLATLAWLWLRRGQAVFGEKKQDSSFLLIQQQIDQLRAQLTQVLDGNTSLIHQQLGQLLGNVTERLKENSELMQQTQQNLGERLDNAARVVGGVQKTLGSLEEANRKIYDVG